VLSSVDCPYCGEPFEAVLDEYSGSQDYIEDCPVCCRPIEFRLQVDPDGEQVTLDLYREDEC